MTKKKLVVSGCSMMADYVTSRNEESDYGKKKLRTVSHGKISVVQWDVLEPHPTVDMILAKHYDLEPLNVAQPGSSNGRIFRNAINAIHSHDIEMMVVCWTSFNRIDIPSVYDNKFTTINSNTYEQTNEFNRRMLGSHRKDLLEIWDKLHELGRINPYIDIDYFYFYVRTLQDMCELYGIKLYQASSLITMYDDKDYSDAMKYFFNHEDFDLIENYYGFPIFTDLGGTALFDDWRPEMCITETDKHPNKLCTEIVAEKLRKFIDETAM